MFYYVTVMPEDGGGRYYVGPLRGVDQSITLPGDSGGPWFLTNTAYGIHSAVIGDGSVFSLMSNALSRFDLILWTG